jgi:hypothetical protein
MATNNVAGVTKAPHLLPCHVRRIVSNKSHCDKEVSAQSARTQDWQGKFEVRGATVIERELGGCALFLIPPCLRNHVSVPLK